MKMINNDFKVMRKVFQNNNLGENKFKAISWEKTHSKQFMIYSVTDMEESLYKLDSKHSYNI